MKKIFSIMAIAFFVLLTNTAFAGGPGKKMGPSCPEACQQQIDDLNSSQAQQNEQLGAHDKKIQNHEGRITNLEKTFDDLWYARVGLRGAWMVADVTNVFDSQDSGPGFGGALAFGREFSMYQMLGKFRAELEFAYQKTDADTYNELRQVGQAAPINILDSYDVDTRLTTIMVNGYYEIPVYDAFSVYGLAGVGYAKYDLEINYNGIDIGSSDNVFAYKAGAGVTYNFSDAVAADLGYEYLGVADTDLATSINGHNVVGSVRFKF
jgi:opacity protein-like surface antigen